MERISPIRIGSRVYLRNAIAGDPGCVMSFDHGKAVVEWADMPELGRHTRHALDSLVLDESFIVSQLDIAFEEQAA